VKHFTFDIVNFANPLRFDALFPFIYTSAAENYPYIKGDGDEKVSSAATARFFFQCARSGLARSHGISVSRFSDMDLFTNTL
jgi:hypothetical protein